MVLNFIDKRIVACLGNEKFTPFWRQQYSNSIVSYSAQLPAVYCQMVPARVPPVAYSGGIQWVPENINVYFEYPGTRVPDKLPDRVPG